MTMQMINSREETETCNMHEVQLLLPYLNTRHDMAGSLTGAPQIKTPLQQSLAVRRSLDYRECAINRVQFKR